MKMVNAIKKLEKEGYEVVQIEKGEGRNRWKAYLNGRTTIELAGHPDVAWYQVGIRHAISIRDALEKSKQL